MWPRKPKGGPSGPKKPTTKKPKRAAAKRAAAKRAYYEAVSNTNNTNNGGNNENFSTFNKNNPQAWHNKRNNARIARDAARDMAQYTLHKKVIDSYLNSLKCVTYKCASKRNGFGMETVLDRNTLAAVVHDCYYSNSGNAPMCTALLRNARIDVTTRGKPDPKFDCAYADNYRSKGCRKLLGPVHPWFYLGKGWGRGGYADEL